MKYYFLSLLLLVMCICFSIEAIGQPSTVTFNKIYPDPYPVDTNFIDNSFTISENNHGYIFPCNSNGYGSNGYFKGEGFNLFQLNLNGDTVWTKRFFKDSVTYAIEIILSDTINNVTYLGGGYNAATYFTGSNLRSSFLMKTNSVGDSIFSKKIYYGLYRTFIEDMIFTKNGNLAMTGFYDDTNSTQQHQLPDSYLMICDTGGNILTAHHYGNYNTFESGSSLVQNDNGDFFILGLINNTTALRLGYLVKTDSVGNEKWHKSYNVFNTNHAYMSKIIKLADQNLLLIGFDDLSSSGLSYQGVAVKIDTGGNVIWKRNYGGIESNALRYGIEMDNHDLIMGWSSKPLTGQENAWVICTDSMGILKWERVFTDSLFNDLEYGIKTRDGGILLTGQIVPQLWYVQNVWAYHTDCWIVKLDSLGCDSAGCPTLVTGINEVKNEGVQWLTVYPNPVNDVIYINFNNTSEKDANIFLYDVNGKQILEFSRKANHQLQIDVRTLAPGMYFLNVQCGEKKESKKVIIRH